MNKLAAALAWVCLWVAVGAPNASDANPAGAPDSAVATAPVEGFVEVNGVRLQYLDWGGSGAPLIMVHGLGSNPHKFDDLAPAFTDRFHVIAYARRGSGGSDVRGPYDIATLTEDLHCLMDALGIIRANLVGHSAGGDEITELARAYPERVDRLVYLDAAYDFADPEFQTAVKALPFSSFERPVSAMRSLDAFRSYQRATWYSELDDMRRVEANLRESVIIQRDGSLKDRTPKEVVDALYSALWSNKRRDYVGVRSPALAIYATHLYDMNAGDTQRRNALQAYEKQHWLPFQSKSAEKVQRELPNAEVVRVLGSHASFFMTDRPEVVDLMRRFLTGSASLAQNRGR